MQRVSRAKVTVGVDGPAPEPAEHGEAFGEAFGAIFSEREREWLEYFDHRVPGLSEDDRRIHLAGTAGLLWCKKYYGWSVMCWLEGDPTGTPPPAERRHYGVAFSLVSSSTMLVVTASNAGALPKIMPVMAM